MLRSQTETVIICTPRELNLNWRKLVDERIRSTVIVDGLQILKVPSMLAFSEIMIKMARALKEEPSIRIIRVSNHTELQVRISLDDENILPQINTLRGSKIEFTFTLPTDGNPIKQPKLNVALCVSTTSLLDVLRSCLVIEGVTIKQIYDTWT